jgi:L-histidine Nalpha-methyltransferase
MLTASRVVRSYLGPGDERSLADDVLDGFTRPFKEIPPKHFYDARGAELYDRITELPEYYPARTEAAILRARAHEIRAGELVELGSGTATKTRLLLGGVRRYVPIDVTEAMVRDSAEALTREFPGLAVHGIVGDFIPGSRRRLLRRIARLLRPGADHLLLGADLVKDPAALEAAYNDSSGVTAEFNRNVLRVINRELDADFKVDAFEHVAFYDREHEWIEMRLRAERRMEVRVEALDLDVRFEPREELRTEISAKFTRERLRADLGAAGLEVVDVLTDADELFALALARP